MLNGFRTIGAAAFWTLALGIAVSGIGAQETNTVGNPQLRDFQLPGPRTVEPPVQQPDTAAPAPTQQQPPVVTTPPVTVPSTTAPTTAPAPAQTTRATPPAAPTDPAPTRRNAAPAPAAPAPTPSEVQEALAVPGPAPAELQEALPSPLPIPAPAAPVEATPTAEPVAAEPASAFPWLYLGLGALALLLGFFAYRKLPGQAEEVYKEPEPVEERPVAEPVMAAPARQPARAPSPAPAPAPAPAAAPAAPVSDTVGIQIRPWLELEFTPDRAAATATEATVQYELTIRNTGNRGARDVRIEARMFNAGAQQEQEIGAFFAEPVRERTPPALPEIAPRSEVKLRSSIVMPKEQVREITVQGRRLFIPTVAFNVVYDWGENRSGQTSTSYVVGREAEAPSERMGPFRLDLGPRLYRSVGQRQTKLARIV
jgi:hypothetical protein